MSRRFRLLAVLAHPDDESLGFGGTLARYAAEGVEVFLVTATRGERGRFGRPGVGAAPDEVGRVREIELRAAAAVLGIREVSVLGYPDGELDQVDATNAIAAVASHVRRIRPGVAPSFCGPHVSRTLARSEYNCENACRELEQVLSDASYAIQATTIGCRIAAEDGVATACARIGAVLSA